MVSEPVLLRVATLCAFTAAPCLSDVSWRLRAAVSSAQQNVSRKRATAGDDRPAKRQKTPADERPEASEPAEQPAISKKKATKKLKKKLGRSPTDAEIAAYIAKKERKKSTAGASQTPAKSPYAKVGGASAVAAAAAGETEAAAWVDSVGEPPHKAMVRHFRSINPCRYSLTPRSLAVSAFASWRQVITLPLCEMPRCRTARAGGTSHHDRRLPVTTRFCCSTATSTRRGIDAGRTP